MLTPPKPRFAILGSGRGSNAIALMELFQKDEVAAELAVVISNVANAPLLARADERGHPSELIGDKGLTREDHEQRLRERLAYHRVDHLLLAGYMRLLSPSFVRGFPGVILNIHPALLPDFPGRTAVADQWRAGVKIAGASVHFVDAGMDTGPLLLTGSLIVRGDEGEAGLAERIRTEVEHVIYPRAVQLLLHRLSSGSPLHQEAARLRNPRVPSSWVPQAAAPNRVLVLGSGGREHAMLRALATSPHVELFCAPGNPGTATLATNWEIPLHDVEELVAAASAHRIELVIAGPESVLALGITGALSRQGIACCGPSQAATQLEASKVYMRALTAPLKVPAPRSVPVTNREELAAAIDSWDGVPVVKADGLASGKGVFLPETKAECLHVAESLLDGLLGTAGRRILLEERLHGEEASLFFACHGTSCVALPHARDHKRLHDGNLGPNTGGMGAVSPHPSIDASTLEEMKRSMVLPTLHELAARGTPFVGFLFVGVMLTAEGPKLLEYNVRLGDPEAAAILPRLADGEFLRLCTATAHGHLSGFELATWAYSTCAVVLASAGYPQSAQVDEVITIDESAVMQSGAFILHNGTRRAFAVLQTSGGRVLTVVAAADTLEQAVASAYQGVTAVRFPGMQLRRDIGDSIVPSPGRLPGSSQSAEGNSSDDSRQATAYRA